LKKKDTRRIPKRGEEEGEMMMRIMTMIKMMTMIKRKMKIIRMTMEANGMTRMRMKTMILEGVINMKTGAMATSQILS
jgi:hypothetical protein